MRRCPACGKEYPDRYRFCESDAAALVHATATESTLVDSTTPPVSAPASEPLPVGLTAEERSGIGGQLEIARAYSSHPSYPVPRHPKGVLLVVGAAVVVLLGSFTALAVANRQEAQRLQRQAVLERLRSEAAARQAQEDRSRAEEEAEAARQAREEAAAKIQDAEERQRQLVASNSAPGLASTPFPLDPPLSHSSASSSGSSAAGTAADQSSNRKNYTNINFRFGIEHPIDWTLVTDKRDYGMRFEFRAPSPNVKLAVDVTRAGSTSPMASWQDMDRRFRKAHGSRYVLISLSVSRLGGLTSARWQFTIQRNSDPVLKQIDHAVRHGGRDYAILFSAPEDQFAKWQETFDRIALSMQFLDAPD